MLILGIALVVVGIVELIVVNLVIRRQMTAAGLGEGAPPPPATIVLRRTAMFEIGIGAILLIIGLAT